MKHKKLFIVSFSILILVGLCIGVFADNTYNDDRLGTVIGSKPFDCGELYHHVSDSNVIYDGYYILEFSYNSIIDGDHDLILWDSNVVNFYYDYSSSEFVLKYDTHNANTVRFTMNVGDVVYVYVLYTNVTLSYTDYNFNGSNVSCDVYSINEFSTIDVYNNSQDVWTHVVSSVTTATNTILDNDILLLFAAALPIISFGAGMLIRLFRKS